MSLFRFLRILIGNEESGTKRSSAKSTVAKSGEKSTSVEASPPAIGGEDEPTSSTHRKLLTKSRRSPSDETRWVQPGEVVTVAGRAIPGMVYLGSGSASFGRIWEGSPFIDPKLRVAAGDADVAGSSFSYWPRYGDLPPQARAAYLDWLADGRRDKRYGAGYAFLFFYGLERRFFVDSPPEDEKRVLVAETERLLRIYGETARYWGTLESF